MPILLHRMEVYGTLTMNVPVNIPNSILLSTTDLQHLSRLKVLYGSPQWRRSWRGNGLIPDELFIRLRDEHARRQTFLQLQWQNTYVSIDALANAGFFYFGDKDKVQCIFCFGVLSDWQPGDGAFYEHQRHFSTCPFVLQLPVGNIPIDQGFSTRVIKVTEERTNSVLELSTIALQYGKYSTAKIPLSNRLSSFTSRFSTFEKWPEGIPVDKEQLTNAGFYYTEKNDSVQCFHCGGVLRRWTASCDPWEEHRRWFPLCQYLANISSLCIFADLMEKNKIDLNVTDLKKGDEDRITATLPVSSSSDKKTKKRKQQTRTDDDDDDAAEKNGSDEEMENDHLDRKCKICLEREIEICFFPCSHVVTCMVCAPQLNACPICRKPFSSSVRIYMA